MRKLLISFALITSMLNAQEDAISQFAYNLLKRVNDFIGEGEYLEAENELLNISSKYYKNEQSYERALINQLFGQLYAMQGKFSESIPWFEKALKYTNLPRTSAQQIRFNLSQSLFQTGEFDKTIDVLLDYFKVAERYKLPVNTSAHVFAAFSYARKENLNGAYYHINIANTLSAKPNKSWIEFQFAIAMRLSKFDDAELLGQRLIFLDPYKKSYWEQLSGVFYVNNKEISALSSIELAYENKALDEEEDFLLLAKYYMFKEAPRRAVEVLEFAFNSGLVKREVDNLELLATAYFLSKDLKKGIAILTDAEKLTDDPKIAFKLGTYAFDNEDYKLAINSLQSAKEKGWDEYPGRIELLMGISYLELEDRDKSLEYLSLAKEFEKIKDTADAWMSYVNSVAF